MERGGTTVGEKGELVCVKPFSAMSLGFWNDPDGARYQFVRLVHGAVLDAELEGTIRTRIRQGASPRHVPAKIVTVGAIPRPKSGKVIELAVRDVVHGREVANRESLENPEALEPFSRLPELAT